MTPPVDREAAAAATSYDVAERAGVSRTTVSLVLNGKASHLPPATVDRVRAAARDLGYRPSAAARALARGSTEVVLGVIPHTTFGDSLQAVFETMTDRLAEAGLTLVLRMSGTTDVELDHLLAVVAPTAMIDLGGLGPADRRSLKARGVRVVEHEFRIAGGESSFAGLNRRMGWLQADHLIGRGCRRLVYAHLSDGRDDPFGDDREAGVRDRCREASIDEPLVIRIPESVAGASAALENLGVLGTGERVGFACYTDEIALAVLRAAAEAGAAAPEDVAVMGSDHSRFGRLLDPPLSTLSIDFARAGAVLADRVLAALGHESVAPPVDADELFRVVVGGTT